MFSETDRDAVREALVARALADPAVAGAALVGSAARGDEDRWSDVDLALQLAEGAGEPAVVAAWTDAVRARFGLADLLDVHAPDARYRVLLLPDSLQVDLSFWPHDRFRATDVGFRLLFGDPAAPTAAPEPDTAELIRTAWLHALHARSALARGRRWQALQMQDGVRERVLALACLRLGMNPWHGRAVDRLPGPLLAAALGTRAASLTDAELARAHRALLALLLDEVTRIDPERAAALRQPLAALAFLAPS